MHLQDFNGRCQLDAEEELIARLSTSRKDDLAAFILWHADGGPSLWVHVNKDLAYLHFFPDGSGAHPGFQATGGTTTGEDVRFLQTGGFEADSITVPRSAVIAVQKAYEAARQFMRTNQRPTLVKWMEL